MPTMRAGEKFRTPMNMRGAIFVFPPALLARGDTSEALRVPRAHHRDELVGEDAVAPVAVRTSGRAITAFAFHATLPYCPKRRGLYLPTRDFGKHHLVFALHA